MCGGKEMTLVGFCKKTAIFGVVSVLHS